MDKRCVKLVLFSFVVIFCLTLISAFSFSDSWNKITGKIVSNNDLVAYYSFDDETANDASGNRHNGILINGESFTSGLNNKGKAAYFDGVNDYIKINNIEIIDKDDFSVSYWIKPKFDYNDGVIRGSMLWLEGGGKYTNPTFFSVLHNTPDRGSSAFLLNTFYSRYWAYTPISFTETNPEWIHLVGVFDYHSKNISLYVNGVKVASVKQKSKGIKGTGVLWIGKSYEDYFKGSIDEVKIFKKALNDKEIRELYDAVVVQPRCNSDSDCLPEETYSCKDRYNSCTTILEYTCVDNKCTSNTGKSGCNVCKNGCNEETGVCYNTKNCLEVIEGHNDPLDTTRINVVFMGLNYTGGVDEFKQRVVKLININGEGSPKDNGLLSEPPFRDYQDSFNLWYINKTLPYNKNTFSEDISYLSNLCSYLNKRQEIQLVQSSSGLAYAILGGVEGGWMVIFDRLNWGIQYHRDIILHEFGHSFGGLGDEYYSGFVTDGNPSIINCDVADSETACSKWCSGKPTLVEDLNNALCEDTSDLESCYKKVFSENLPCDWYDENNNIFGKTGCINIVKICTSIHNRDTCENSEPVRSTEKICYWADTVDPYFQSNCIPVKSHGVNIGKNCINDTGCFQGCSASNWFRSSVQSKMYNANSPWKYINEQHLRSLLEGLDSVSTLKEKSNIITEKSNTVFYDKFDINGKIVDGEMIDLNNLDEETIEVLEKRTNTKSSLIDKGNIDSDKINPQILFEEYSKIKKESIKKSILKKYLDKIKNPYLS